MKKFTERDLKALTLLSIVVPVGLLVSFRLTGILPEPEGPITIAETTTLETVKAEFERPNQTVHIWRSLVNSYEKNNLSIRCNVFVGTYVREFQDYGGSDFVDLIINITATSSNGYVNDVVLTLREKYANSRINFFDQPPCMKLENLSIADMKDWATEVFVNLTGVNDPRRVCFWVPVHWVLPVLNGQPHLIEIIFETVYFDRSTYRSVIQPFQVSLLSRKE